MESQISIANAQLDAEELEFLKSQTGIQDEGALSVHISKIGSRAVNEVFRYGCILNSVFAKFKISRLPAYPDVLELGRTREKAILLDIGCCFGHDLRKVVADGFPINNVVASDLHPEFWVLGHEIFQSTVETFPAGFVPGDALDPDFILPRKPFLQLSDVTTERPDLHALKSLTPLQGHVSVIHASAFFHLFDQTQQQILGERLGSLLSPLPGSVIFGVHRALLDGPGILTNIREEQVFCHSPESWKNLWDGGIFPLGTVKVEADLVPRMRDGKQQWTMRWSVTRI
ncbi:hypothetical protein K435DRAFT_320303 [Dendrothele bispora CBS 962.96]|uniref:Methyltransferase domain-containing protein n=1 Tax=Dendrothele bispora (strain CBS 962.96) TaxID=1314807 RepID=A0A4S8MJ47_DENBC|nr:hypothetical protein K435DRAFT_320303 [Dendrothele bispora CBS 962.96]